MNASKVRQTLALPLSLSLALLSLGACASLNQRGSTTSAGEFAGENAAGGGKVARTAAWLAEMDRGAEAPGPGALEIASADGDLAAPDFLELAALHIDVKTAGPMARYEVEHIFHNPGEATLEGTFRFPLPAGAIVTGLAMEIDGQLMDGEILEREKARKIYEQIVDQMRDPALLEWEAGQTFKLRVFPIEAGERKRVVMRYMAPLLPDDEAESGLAVAVPTATPAMQTSIPELSVRVDGVARVTLSDHDARENIRLPLARAATPAFVSELGPAPVLHSDDSDDSDDSDTTPAEAVAQRYFALRLDLDWAEVPAPGSSREDRETRSRRGRRAQPATHAQSTQSAQPRRTVIVVDSSRSALESWAMAREAAQILLASLDPDEPFTLVTSDLAARVFQDGFSTNDAASREAALAFMSAVEPDGASDLGATLDSLGALGLGQSPDSRDRVIYIGDGTPTWGSTERGALVERARQNLGSSKFYALSVGKRESREILEALTGALGGRTARPQSLDQVEAFARFLDRAPSVRQLADVRVELPGVEGVHAPTASTWFEGERPVVNFRLAIDQAVPSEVVVRGIADGRAFEQRIALGAPTRQVGVRQQWAARELGVLPDKASMVALSVEHGVLGKHTALLVLESEEAYARYEIERRNGPRAARPEGDPRISGRDLDQGGDPYLGPGDLQPGDPEIHIPAPRDARSVEVLFPDGETKSARWEEALGQWSLRFLVDDDVEAGTYDVLVRVTHADGHVQILNLDYTIDMHAPELRLELRLREDGAYDLFAHQVLTQADAARERPQGRDSRDPEAQAQASTLDARRVEVLMPDGQTLNLRRGLEGHFVRRWAPKGAIEWPATATVVVGDRALNNRRMELPLVPPELDAGGRGR